MAEQRREPASRPGREAAAARPKRFYEGASVGARGDGFALLLDGRSAKTPAKNALVLPSQDLAEALAAEWEAQRDVIDPVAMPLTRIANTAIDGVAGQMQPVGDEVKTYLASDLLIYRAADPAPLVAAEIEAWDPLLAWAAEAFEVALTPASGISFVAQLPATLAALADAVDAIVGVGPAAPFRLAALHVMTTLTGSAILALAVMHRHVAPDEAWRIAHVDELFQEKHWGADDEALERRARRWIEMKAAAAIGLLA